MKTDSLGRQIDRKPVACIDGNGYFLMPVGSLSLARFEMKILAFSKINELALVSVLRPQDSRRVSKKPNSAPRVLLDSIPAEDFLPTCSGRRRIQDD
jgi:hypothetical protein